VPRPVLVVLVAATVLLALVPAAWSRTNPVEDYATYEPATACRRVAQPGTVLLGRWIVHGYGGRFGSTVRPCGGSRSEHHEGRAFDWTVDVRRPADRARVRRLFADLFATDAAGNRHARARRMGIMYVIWNDRIWSAWNGFRAEPYLSSSCPTLRRCSRTLRHQDHLHVSISRAGAAGLTSWYVPRMEARTGPLGPRICCG
jgi:hypothetical protein